MKRSAVWMLLLPLALVAGDCDWDDDDDDCDDWDDACDFFFVVPYGEDPSPKNDVLTFSTNIKQADVAFLMDTTGSMSGSINAH